MWHLREITDDEVTIDILTYGEGELRLVMCEAVIFEDFSNSDDVSFFIWHLDPDESESWNWRLDADGFCLQCQGEILLQGFDLREADSLRGAESVLDHGGTDTLLFHIDIDAELEKGFLDEEGFLFDLIR